MLNTLSFCVCIQIDKEEIEHADPTSIDGRCSFLFLFHINTCTD